jgi:fumarate reductase flavoprotein subunit
LTIIVVSSKEFKITIPVLIIGGGACGLTAALAASDAGSEVLVLERDSVPHGSTGMSYGAVGGAGTEVQKQAGIDDSSQLFFEDIMAITRGKTDPEMARTIATESGPALDWLASQHAVNLTIEKAWTGLGHRRPRLHAPLNRSGVTLLSMLTNACEKSGVDILPGARVDALFSNGQNEVLGARFVRPDGTVEEVGCKTLVLATCGFGANKAMISEHITEIADAKYYGHEGNTGDGILWGEALGGVTADMSSYQALGSLADPQAMVIPHTLLIGGGIQVNQLGRRFENELDDISGQALTVLEQPNGICWMVYDQRLHEGALANFEEYRSAIELKTASTAEDLDELALLMKVPASSLQKTISEVNGHILGDTTDPLGRDFLSVQKMQAPYYAIRVTGALFHTQGGLCIDSDAAVVDAKGQPLPNLFAGGGAARSVSGPGAWGYLPAMGLCTAITFGRLAGQSAAKLSCKNI